jgi:hypothetical protein
MTSPFHLTPSDAITLAIVGPIAVVAALSALKLLRVIVGLVNARIRARRQPTWRADWENACTGVDVLGDGGWRLD